jgi:hypothetical protein
MMRKFETPILVTAYNRPDLLEKILTKLNEFNCSKVYITIDGPKIGSLKDKTLVSINQSLAISFNSKDPHRNNFLEKNNGCKYAMIEGINWFFQNENEGIILEDDIDFEFQFLSVISQMLNTYRNNFNVGSVTGYNPLDLNELTHYGFNETKFLAHSYFSSWGWATWKNRWELYPKNLGGWKSFNYYFDFFRHGGLSGLSFWRSKYCSLVSGLLDTWDYAYIFMQFRHKLMCVMPPMNLVNNVGFRDDATHTKGVRVLTNYYPEYKTNEYLLNSNDLVFRNSELDRLIRNKVYGIRPLSTRIKEKLLSYGNRSNILQ